MDALKDIPNNIDRIETLKGVAYLQKTDIFKKMMWFSFPGAENWIAIPVQQVKEFVEMNKQGIKPEAISSAVDNDEVREEKNINYDYENVVGQDSLTRLDDRNKRKKKRKSKSNTVKPESKAGQKTEKSEQSTPRQSAKPQISTDAVAPSANKENKEGSNNRPKKRFNRHRNKNKGNNNNAAPKAE
jgi:hypothetical protein